MIIWYSVWLEENKTEIPEKKTENIILDSNDCQHWELVGDGYCDDKTNVEECGYDGNDCCEMESDKSYCTNCSCFITEQKFQNIKNEFQAEYCSADWITYLPFLGDGACQLNYNQGICI